MAKGGPDYQAAVQEVRGLLTGGFPGPAAMKCLVLIEVALRRLIKENLPALDGPARRKFNKAEEKIGGDTRGVEDFGFGQLIGLIRESGFLESWEQSTGKSAQSFRMVNLNQVNGQRIAQIHQGEEVPRVEAELLFAALQAILETFGLLSPGGGAAAAPPPAPTAGDLHCPLCGRFVEARRYFRCKECGRNHLCLSHQDSKSYRCEECERKAAGAGGKPLEMPDLVYRGRNEQGCEEYESTITGAILVRIAGGAFDMGSDDIHASNDEKPVHRVEVGDFLIGKCPVTVGEYRRFCESTARRMPGATKLGWSETNPMVKVSWDDAVAYCQWAHGRLPSEVEWEYAAGGGAAHQKWAGAVTEDELGSCAWYGGNSSGWIHPVGGKQANLFGLCDMSGNVWEWCSDWYDEGGYAESQGRNPQGPPAGNYRVLRGGDWKSDPWRARVSYRSMRDPGLCYANIGFRLAMTPGSTGG